MPASGPGNEHKPPLKSGDLNHPTEVKIVFDIDPTGNCLTLIMKHEEEEHNAKCSGPNRCIAVGEDLDNAGYYLKVPPGEDRTFILTLSTDRWRWEFDKVGSPDDLPLSIKSGDHKLYGVDYVDQHTIKYYAKARRHGEAPGREPFNLYLLLDQVGAKPLPIRIDPVTENPPSGRDLPEGHNGTVPARWMKDI